MEDREHYQSGRDAAEYWACKEGLSGAVRLLRFVRHSIHQRSGDWGRHGDRVWQEGYMDKLRDWRINQVAKRYGVGTLTAALAIAAGL